MILNDSAKAVRSFFPTTASSASPAFGIEKEFYKNTKERELVLKRKINKL
jgi:hypothetical protein